MFLIPYFSSAAGVYPYCRGPLQNAAPGNWPNDQFNCPTSVPPDINNYPYECTDGASIFCVNNNTNVRYDCTGSFNDSGIEWWILGCSSADTQPPTISSFTGAAVSSNQISLSWSASDNIGVTRISIEEWRFSNNAGYWLAGSADLAGTATSYTFNNLFPNTTYEYRLNVYDAASNYTGTNLLSITTPSDSFPPSTPTLFSPSCSSSSCALSWSASTDTGGSGLGGYKIYRNGTQVDTAGPAAASYTDSGLSPLTSYSYYIIAYDNVNNSSPQSNTVTGTTTAAPDTTAPTSLNPNLQAVRDAINPSSQINLSWNAYTDNVGVVGYRIERCQGAGCSNFGFLTNVTAGTAYNNSGLPSLTSFSYRIQAYDAANNLSSYSNIATASTAAPPDTTSPNFIFTSPSDPLPSGTTSATLGGTTNEGALCAYSTTGGQSFSSMTPMTTTDGFSHSTQISGLSDNQSYTYYVKCRDGASPPNVSSDFIITFSVATPPPDTSPPLISGGQPTGILAYFPSGSGTVTMSVLTNEAVYCRYSQAIDTDFNLMVANSLDTLPVSDPMYQRYHFTTLTVSNGLNYAYYVRCQDTTGPNTNTSGYPISFSVSLPPNTLPTADLTASPTSGAAPLQVSTTGSAADPDNDPIIECSMDWGDGTSDPCSLDVSANHTYSNAGNYVITLTVADSRGGRASDIQPITVDAAPQNNQLPTIIGGICAVECNSDDECGSGFVCSPSRICVPEAALDNSPVRSKGYASLPDDSQNQPADSAPAVFSAGASVVKIGLATDAQSECRFAVNTATNNGIAGATYNFSGSNVIMNQFSTTDYLNHSAIVNIGAPKSCAPNAPKSCGYDKQDSCPANGKCDSYGFSAICRNINSLASNTTDYPLYFNIGAPDLMPCAAGEMCPNGAICSDTGDFANRCPPATYTCIPNQYFFRYNIPYMLDVCVPR